MKRLIAFLLLLLVVPQIHAANLAQSTARELVVDMVGKTSGSLVTGIAAANVTCRFVENDLTSSTFTAGAGGHTWTEIGHGSYKLAFAAGDVDVLGNWSFTCSTTTEVYLSPVYQVLGASAPTFSGSYASIDDSAEYDCANVANANSPAGRTCGNKFLRYDATGTVDSGSTTSIVDTERTEADGSWANRAYVVINSGAGIGQSARVTAFVASSGTLTLSPALQTPVTAGDTYELRSLPATSTSADVNVTQWAGTNVATPDTAGYPKVTIKDGTGQGELSITAGQLDGLSTPAQVATAVWSNIPANAFTAAKFDPDVSAEFAATLMGTTVEGAETFKNFLRYGAAMLFNNYTSSGGTFQFKDLSGSKTRITYGTTATSRTISGSRDATD